MRLVYYYKKSKKGNNKDIKIDVYGILVPFAKVHMALLSGLKIRGDYNINMMKLGDNIRVKYFGSERNIKQKTLDVVYRSIQAVTDEDVVKLALLYFLTLWLLSNAKTTLVFDICFRIMNSLVAINGYPWGSYDCINEIEPTEEESNEIREKGLIASEKASLKRKLVVEEETEVHQKKDDDVIEVHSIHPSKRQKVKLGAVTMEHDFCEIVL
ncbi:hypothetical protein PanWU01x14_323010 [Parasponia andersonii]|uniref:DUF1985 domain-containing protein n=1 Tax=Parasponia andersonii TaxID=3476 RepID=A0A2P5AKN8_PARAD|nr:hypothetical protein PanWU01x14_323010 [Parasponia andersonii]